MEKHSSSKAPLMCVFSLRGCPVRLWISKVLHLVETVVDLGSGVCCSEWGCTHRAMCISMMKM